MQIFIDEKEILTEQLDAWKLKRTKKAAKLLNFKQNKNDNLAEFTDKFTVYKTGISYDKMLKKLKTKLAFTTFAMKLACGMSRKRKASVTVIKIKGLSAQEVSDGINNLMTQLTPDIYVVNLAAYPEHYALLPTKNGMFEVVETPGNSPMPIQFFIKFGDESGLVTARDESYQYQSTGVAKLKNGSVIGGVRHQFKDTIEGCEARLCVEFPSIVANKFIKGHQLHLATEFSYWINYIAESKKGV